MALNQFNQSCEILMQYQMQVVNTHYVEKQKMITIILEPIEPETKINKLKQLLLSLQLENDTTNIDMSTLVNNVLNHFTVKQIDINNVVIEFKMNSVLFILISII
jgi:hypothetical protein